MALLHILPLRRLALSALLLASLSTQAAAQTAGACLTEGEARSLMLYALPEVSGQLSEACTANLPGTAYLVRSRTALAARFDKAAIPATANARIAFSKVAGLPPKAFAKLDDKTMRNVISMGISSAMGTGIKADTCRIINDVLEQLDPLPAENVAALLGVALREGGKDKQQQGKSPFRICGTEEGK